jgi:hypothetical protein
MTITTIDRIKADAFDQDELLKQAFRDAVAALTLFALDNRSTREATTLLAGWADTFGRLHHKHALEKAGRRS